MNDQHPPDLDEDDVNRLFNDLARNQLSAPVQPRCECNCNGAEMHADRKCSTPGKPNQRRAALYLMALHRYGWCDADPDSGGIINPATVDADGNITAYMCQACSDHAIAVSRRNVAMLLDATPPGITPTCPTCGRDIARWQDITQRKPI